LLDTRRKNTFVLSQNAKAKFRTLKTLKVLSIGDCGKYRSTKNLLCETAFCACN